MANGALRAIARSILSFTNRLRVYVKANGEHSE